MENSVVLKFQAGQDNRNREYELPEGTARELNNLDVTKSGGVCCRLGTRLVFAGDVHSLYAPPQHSFLLLVKDNVLSCLDTQNILTELTTVEGPVVYAMLNDVIFWSDGASRGQILADGTLGIWGLPSPPLPSVVATTGGSLGAGIYQVTMTAIHVATGLESGANEPVSIDVVENGMLSITTPSASVDFMFSLYLTPPFGERHELRRVALLAPSITVNISVPSFGKLLSSLLAVSPYPAQRLVVYKGRIWGAIDKTIWVTSEQSPHWLFPATGFLQYESKILMLGTTEDGIYVGLYDRVYFLQGNDLQTMTQRIVSYNGALGGSELPTTAFQTVEPLARQCCWWDKVGIFCIGKPNGMVVMPNQSLYSAGEATTGVSCYREIEGIKQVISVLSSNSLITGALQATDTSVP